MHFDILVEDISGKRLLEMVVPKIINAPNSWNIIPYKGVGNLPGDLKTRQDASKRILLEQLPRLLRGFGRRNRNPGYENAVVIVVVDSDNRNCRDFKRDLVNLLESCNPKPVTFFRIAIEEIEAWLLGDINAIGAAYPNFNQSLYTGYRQDSIIGTWELLADIVMSPSEAAKLKKGSYHETGLQKSIWAEQIGKNMNVRHNRSPSFNCFREKLEELGGRADL